MGLASNEGLGVTFDARLDVTLRRASERDFVVTVEVLLARPNDRLGRDYFLAIEADCRGTVQFVAKAQRLTYPLTEGHVVLSGKESIRGQSVGRFFHRLSVNLWPPMLLGKACNSLVVLEGLLQLSISPTTESGGLARRGTIVRSSPARDCLRWLLGAWCAHGGVCDA